jgi:hypothetical protein
MPTRNLYKKLAEALEGLDTEQKGAVRALLLEAEDDVMRLQREILCLLSENQRLREELASVRESAPQPSTAESRKTCTSPTRTQETAGSPPGASTAVFCPDCGSMVALENLVVLPKGLVLCPDCRFLWNFHEAGIAD